MSRLMLRHPFVTSIVVLMLGTSVGIAYAWVRNDVEWHLDYTVRMAKKAEAQSTLRTIFPQQTPEAGFQPQPAPDFTLTDEDGRLVSLSAFGGKVVLLNFISTECTDICPQNTRELRGLQKLFSSQMGKGIFILSVTVDPVHDTPSALKAYGEKNGVDFRSWHFLTGTEADLAKLRKGFGVRAENVVDEKGKPDIAHSAATFVIDPDGWIRVKLLPASLTLFGQTVVERVLAMSNG